MSSIDVAFFGFGLVFVLGYVFLLPGIVIYLFVRARRQARDLGYLQRRIDELIAGAMPPPQAETPASSKAAEPAPTGPAPVPKSPWPVTTAAPARQDRTGLAGEDPGPSFDAPAPVASGPSLVDRALTWLGANWFYAVAALALILAGGFLVQYGAERGLFPPRLRVLLGLAFAGVLVAVGEAIRRRWGDTEDAASAYIPSVLSGAGIVTAFAAILSARQLYDLIGAGTSLVGLAAVALGAVVLGWFHGPLLVAIGLLGGAVAPFLVGGDPATTLAPLHAYFLVLAFLGLGVDALRRWTGRWVSSLALALGFGGTTLLVLAEPSDAPVYMIALGSLALGALTLPVARLWPDHDGPMLWEVLRGRRPAVETWIAGLSILAASLLPLPVAHVAPVFATVLFIVLFAAIAIWAETAEALQDLALLPVAGLFGCMALVGASEGPTMITLFLLAAAAMALAAVWRAGRSTHTHVLGWSLAAVLIAPIAGAWLHLTADAPRVLGSYPWALHAMGVAAALTGFAVLWAKADGTNRLRPSLAALLATTVIAYAMGQVLGETALTLAIAVLAAGAAWLDRRSDLPLLAWFVVVAAPVSIWRLVAEPGIDWVLDSPLPLVLLSLAGPVAAYGLAALWLRGRDRVSVRAVAESTFLVLGGISVTLLLWRGLEASGAAPVHLEVGLVAAIWLGLALSQLWLLGRAPAALPRLRLGLAIACGGVAALAIGTTLIPASALLFPGDWNAIAGPMVLNTLLPAYLLPALLVLALWRMVRRQWPDARWPYAIAALGVALVAHWAVLTIRHAWRGAGDMSLLRGVSQGELTTYTVALLLCGSALFYQGVASGAALLRKAGTAVLALTMAKVFFVDVWSLDGLPRIGALVALAGALLALAWLYRWADGRARPDVQDDPPSEPLPPPLGPGQAKRDEHEGGGSEKGDEDRE